jgi:hypothetical protein
MNAKARHRRRTRAARAEATRLHERLASRADYYARWSCQQNNARYISHSWSMSGELMLIATQAVSRRTLDEICVEGVLRL